MGIHAARRRVNLSGAKTLAACCLNRSAIAAGNAIVQILYDLPQAWAPFPLAA